METLLILVVIIIAINVLNALLGGKQRKDQPRKGPSVTRERGIVIPYENREEEEVFPAKGRGGEEEGPEPPSSPFSVETLEKWEKVEGSTTPGKKKRKKRKRSSHFLLDFSGEEVVKGVVWSEIIGPPRSKGSSSTHK